MLTDANGALAKDSQGRCRTDLQPPPDVTNNTTVHCHRHYKVTHERLAAAIGVVSDELAAAIFAQVLLFLVGGCAILLVVPRGTPRTSDFFKAHTSKNNLSEAVFQRSINSETPPTRVALSERCSLRH